ncbi:MAG: acyl carrier protein [Hyphomicrobium sp.]
MSTDEIYEKLTQIFHDVFDDDSIALKPELTAADVEEWDSLNHIRLVLAVEKEFGVKFSAAHVASLKNVGDLVKLIQERAPKK